MKWRLLLFLLLLLLLRLIGAPLSYGKQMSMFMVVDENKNESECKVPHCIDSLVVCLYFFSVYSVCYIHADCRMVPIPYSQYNYSWFWIYSSRIWVSFAYTHAHKERLRATWYQLVYRNLLVVAMNIQYIIMSFIHFNNTAFWLRIVHENC